MSTVYLNAAAALTSFLNREGGLKSLLYSPSSQSSLSPQLYLLVTETLRYKDALDSIIDSCRLLRLSSPAPSRPLLLVMLYDLLFGAKAISGGGHVKRLLLSQRTPIQSALARLYIAKGASTPLQLLPLALRPRPPHPRYVRVNTLRLSVESAVEALQAQGVELIAGPPFTSAQSFYRDEHVPALLVFPPATAFHANPLYLSSALILQDKASCLPALCLSPGPDDVVVDGCAAPGNKTSHLLALMRASGGQGRGSVDAFEVDYKRYSLLCEMLARKGAEVRVHCSAGCHAEEGEKKGKGVAGVRVTAHHASFLSLDGTQGLGRRVTALLLDPTCSGSGALHSIDAYYKEKGREDAKTLIAAQRQDRKKATQKGLAPPVARASALTRKRPHSATEADAAAAPAADEEAVENQASLDPSLASLSAFQLSLLLHAFTLPALRHVVYSTCSVHTEENEGVVARALAEGGRRLGWEVEAGLVPGWKRRGVATPGLSEEETARMIRCDADEDLMNGFFVCGLRRTGAGGGEEKSAGQSAAHEGAAQPTAAEEKKGRGEAVPEQAAKKKRKKKRKKPRTADAVDTPP